MIDVTVVKARGRIHSLRVRGHAEYGRWIKDQICIGMTILVTSYVRHTGKGSHGYGRFDVKVPLADQAAAEFFVSAALQMQWLSSRNVRVSIRCKQKK